MSFTLSALRVANQVEESILHALNGRHGAFGTVINIVTQRIVNSDYSTWIQHMHRRTFDCFNFRCNLVACAVLTNRNKMIVQFHLFDFKLLPMEHPICYDLNPYIYTHVLL